MTTTRALTRRSRTAAAVAVAVLAGGWPLSPRPEVVHRFDPPAHRWEAGHRGVDLLGHADQTVRALQQGTVTFAGELAGRGVVVVDHGATRTTYEPVRAAVGVGDQVDAGSRLGRLQRGGSHCSPRVCLHLGLIRGDTYLDPGTLLGPRRVRLLPLDTPALVALPGLQQGRTTGPTTRARRSPSPSGVRPPHAAGSGLPAWLGW